MNEPTTELVAAKPTRVDVAIPEREVTDAEFAKAIREEGGGRLSAERLRNLETIGVRVKGTGTLMGIRGEGLLVRSVLWNSLEKLQTLLDRAMDRPDKDKRKIADAVKITDGMANVTKQIVEAQKVMVEMESRTSDAQGQIRETPLPPRNMGMAPGQQVMPGIIVTGREIHLHEK